MMIKIITPNSQNFGDSVSSLIKVSSKGLVGSDLSAFVKRAGDEAASVLKGIEFKPGEQPIHMIAIGATEAYGPNRNGDGFKEATCRKYHDTFVKHARWYRNHKNKDPQQSYGLVKASMYNEKMKRVELIVALNATKEAAARNKGLVADKEMQKIASGDNNWGVSMACKVAYDVCSGCGNKAKHRGEYCTEDMCKYGGCSSNLTKVAEDGHVLHVDNPNPTWFDISDVYRPADRIAWVVGHYKAASGLYVAGGAELAEMAGVGMPDSVWSSDLSKEAAKLVDIARQMAVAEKSASNSPAFMSAVGMKVKPLGFWKKSAIDGVYPWSACARNGIVVSLEDWLATKGQEKLAGEIKRYLPGVFSGLIGDVSTIEKLAADRSSDPSYSVSTEKQAADAGRNAQAHSINPNNLEAAVRSAVISNSPAPAQVSGFDKSAESSDKHLELARAYAVHQLQWVKSAATSGDTGHYCRVITAYNRLA
jgi:hypothetical protein